MTNIPDTEFLQPVTLVVKATQYDNPDRYAVTTLTVTRGGIFDSDLQFLQRAYSVRILENAPLNRYWKSFEIENSNFKASNQNLIYFLNTKKKSQFC